MEEPAVVAVGAGLLTCRDVDRGSYFLLLTSSFLLDRNCLIYIQIRDIPGPSPLVFIYLCCMGSPLHHSDQH